MIWLAELAGLGHVVFVAVGLLIYIMGTRIGRQRRHPSAAMAWVVSIIAFPYAAVPLFLLFGTRKFARPVRLPHGAAAREIVTPLPKYGPEWALQLLACMEMAHPVRNDSIELHGDGAQALRGLLHTIETAERSLDISTYVFAHDEIGERVSRALQRAVQRGVVIRLLVDAVGSLRTPPGMLRALRSSGVQVQRFMPMLHNPMRGRTNLRNHRKLVVSDGLRLWSGGRNLAGEYFLDLPGQPAWVDLSYEAQGPLAAQAAAQFAADWQAASGRVAHGAQPHPASDGPEWGPWAQWLPSGPDHADDTMHTLLLAGAYHARERIVAVTPYFVPDDALLDAWCMACRRGVQVSLLVPHRSNHRLADWARERALRELSAAGAQVWLATGMVHAKVVLVDDNLALLGSLNLDARSLFLNYEVMTAFYSPAQLCWLFDWCTQQITHAQPYQARRPSWLRDIAEGVVRAVGFQL